MPNDWNYLAGIQNLFRRHCNLQMSATFLGQLQKNGENYDNLPAVSPVSNRECLPSPLRGADLRN